MKKEYWMYLGFFAAGVILANKAKGLPVIGPKIPQL